MPIYAYRCAACGHSRDVLQKMSDAPLSVCPECGAEQFQKQLTAPGFQLKGSGWYQTDFRNNGSGPAPATTPASGVAAPSPDTPKPASEASSSGSSTPPATPCGGSCACH